MRIRRSSEIVQKVDMDDRARGQIAQLRSDRLIAFTTDKGIGIQQVGKI